MKTKGFIRKTVLSVALLVAMVMSMLAGAVMASAEPPTYSEQEINPDAKGRVTVTKYIANAPVSVPGNGSGTQADQSAINTLDPASSNKNHYSTLEGATFVLIKIKDLTYLKSYYSGSNEDALTYTAADLTDVDVSSGTNTSWTAKYKGEAINNADGQSIFKCKTDSNGVATMSNLPLGIYVLREINPPAHVGTVSQDSLISIPMVNSASSDNTGSDAVSKWLYDIYVYPKNTAADATVNINKVGMGDTPLSDVVFQLWYVDLGSDGQLLKTGEPAAVNWQRYNNINYTTDTYGSVAISDLKGSQYGRQYKLVEVSASNGYIADSNPIYFHIDKDRIIHWNAESDGANGCSNTNYGGRFPANNVTTDSTKELTVKIHNEKPTFEKLVQSNPNESTTKWDHDAEYAINQEIQYRLNFYVPTNAANLSNLKVEDIPCNGITDGTNVTITYMDGTETKTLETTKYVVASTAQGGGGFTVDLKNGAADLAGKQVTLLYSAKLNQKAEIKSNGNLNTAQLTYSTRFGSETGTDNGITNTIKDKCNVYTFEYVVTKYKDKIADTNKLKDNETVEFQLLDTGKTVIPVVVVNETDGIYRLADAAEIANDADEGNQKKTTTTMKTGTSENRKGMLTIQGLANTTATNKYYLKETKTISGYNLLTSPFEITVNVSETTIWTTTDIADVVDTSGNRTQILREYQSVTFGADSVASGSIVNKKGFVLPQTGSMGYLLFCTVGIVLVAGGTVMLFGTRKKKIR